MTAAQKTAKAKFKQAIAYRQKTGVSLKEAFAHIYGKKVGAVKKKAAPKKKAAKKVVGKIEFLNVPAFKGKELESMKKGFAEYINEKRKRESKKKIVKKKAEPKKKAANKKIGYSKIRLKQEKGITKVLKNTPRTLFPYTAEEKIVKAGKKYFDEQAKKISGFNKSLYNDIDSINNRIYKLKGIILDEKWSIKNAKKIGYSIEQINMAKHFIAQNTKAIKELQIHLKELKKII